MGPDYQVVLARNRGNRELAVKREYAYLMLLLGENDPLLDVAGRYPHIRYNSLLYTFSFREGLKGLDGRITYVEIATL